MEPVWPHSEENEAIAKQEAIQRILHRQAIQHDLRRDVKQPSQVEQQQQRPHIQAGRAQVPSIDGVQCNRLQPVPQQQCSRTKRTTHEKFEV